MNGSPKALQREMARIARKIGERSGWGGEKSFTGKKASQLRCQDEFIGAL